MNDYRVVNGYGNAFVNSSDFSLNISGIAESIQHTTIGSLNKIMHCRQDQKLTIPTNYLWSALNAFSVIVMIPGSIPNESETNNYPNT